MAEPRMIRDEDIEASQQMGEMLSRAKGWEAQQNPRAAVRDPVDLVFLDGPRSLVAIGTATRRSHVWGRYKSDGLLFRVKTFEAVAARAEQNNVLGLILVGWDDLVGFIEASPYIPREVVTMQRAQTRPHTRYRPRTDAGEPSYRIDYSSFVILSERPPWYTGRRARAAISTRSSPLQQPLL